MLDFFYTASEVISAISNPSDHEWLTRPKNANYYVEAQLTRNGIKRTILLDSRTVQDNYRHFKRNNFKLAPLFDLGNAINDPDIVDFLNERLFQPMELLFELAPEHPAVKELRDRIGHHKIDPLSFFNDLKDSVFALDGIQDAIDSGKTVVVLFDNFKSAQSDDSIVFFSYSSYKKLVRMFLDKDTVACDNDVIGHDIFGDVGPLVLEKLEKVRCGNLTEFSPYQRNDQTTAYARYGLNSVTACPLTKKSKRRIYHAMSFMTAPELYGTTWIGESNYRTTIIFPDLGDVKSSTDDQRSLDSIPVLESLAKIVPQHDNTAKKRGGKKDKEISVSKSETISEYQRLAQTVIKALQGIQDSNPEATYQMLSIHRPGRGAPIKDMRQNVPFGVLASSLDFWSKAVSSPNPRDRATQRDRAIRPLEVPNILNKLWTRGANLRDPKKRNTKPFLFASGLDLFLSHDIELAMSMIRHISKHHVWLMFDVVSRAHHFDRSMSHDHYDVFKLYGLISILYLIKENIVVTEEDQDNMSSEVAYCMGRALGFADIMHQRRFRGRESFPDSFVGEMFFPMLIGGTKTRDYWSRFMHRIDPISRLARRYIDVYKKADDVKSWEYRLGQSCVWFSSAVKKVGDKIPERFSAMDKCLLAAGFYSVM